MKELEVKNQTIEVKGSHHPDSLADRFADVAINSIEKNSPQLYANLDKSYLKGGRFPEFCIQGYMSFDKNKYSTEYLYNLFDEVKRDVVKEFKSIFPDPVIKISYNLNLEPSNKDQLMGENLFTDTAYVTGIRKFSEQENDMFLLTSFLNDIEYTMNDFKIMLLGGEYMYINQTFFSDDEFSYEKYIEKVSEYVYSLPSFKDVVLQFNPDKNTKGIFYSRYGSSVFFNSSGSVGAGNQWYGFNSPERKSCETPYGKHKLHPAKYLVNLAKNHLTHPVENTKSEYILFGKISDRLDNYKYIY